MTRIIAGANWSLQLKPAAKATRPTSDRVKESMFAKLESLGLIEGAKVLDLFAGTGALGLESASRGADLVELVEKDRKAFDLLSQNAKAASSALEKQGATPKIQLSNLDAEKYLRSTLNKFDLVFIDPPYDYPNNELDVLLDSISNFLAEEGLVVVERSSRSDNPQPKKLELHSSKTYGDTSVWIFQKP